LSGRRHLGPQARCRFKGVSIYALYNEFGVTITQSRFKAVGYEWDPSVPGPGCRFKADVDIRGCRFKAVGTVVVVVVVAVVVQ
jgi:hypothetical protein